MTPTFSIVSPSFNSLRYVRRCVGSVRGQGDIEYEHLIHDGASTDGTVDWLRTQSNLSVVSEKDAGMYDAINRGWARARGQIVSWLNTDEQYLPGTLAAVEQVFKSRPDTDVVFGDMIIVGPEGEPLAARREIPLRQVYLRNRFLYAYSCTLFFHRRLLDRGELVFDTKYRCASDYDLMLRLMERRVRIVQLSRYLSLFGVDGTNLSATARSNEEGEEIRLRHGAFRSRPARMGVALARSLERLARGCYARDRLTYQFALDETPRYRQFACVPTKARFSFERSAT